ncbi:AFG1/ZapE family ATPase, partial [Microbacterium lacticum]
MVAALVPPPQFDDATFETYRADPEHPSQQEAKDLLIAFSRGGAPAERGGLFRRAKKAPEMKPGVYLDGGFGVGKTHLLASIYHAMPARR